MRIAVFDIDGTLTATSQVDGHYFSVSVCSVLQIPFKPDWSKYTEVTDSAIVAELSSKHWSGDWRELESRVQQHFFSLLEAALEQDPNAFSPVLGAPVIFEEVRRGGWTPVIATGGWRQSAEMKLRGAGIPTDGVPMVSSSDHLRRVDIIRGAIRQATANPDADAVLIGDASWDLQAARELGMGFIGRADGDAEQLLRSRGATAVVPDFTDPQLLLRLMADSRPPR